MQVTQKVAHRCNFHEKFAANEQEIIENRLLLKEIGIEYFSFNSHLGLIFNPESVADVHSTLIELDSLLTTGKIGYHTPEDLNRIRMDFSEIVLNYFVSTAQNSNGTDKQKAIDISALHYCISEYLTYLLNTPNE